MNIPISASGRSTVIIKAAVDVTINGHNYKKGELITSIVDVDINIAYSNLSKNISAKNNLIIHSEFYPNILELRGKNISQGIMELLFGKKLDINEQKIPIVYTDFTDENGSITLRHLDFSELIIMDSNTRKVLDFIEDEGGVIDLLPEETDVIVTYYYPSQPEFAYQLEKSLSPLLKIEILNEININNTTRKQLITIDKANLITEPNFSFFKNEINNITLGFGIIDGVMKVVYF